jgi:hypothetical protein
MLSTRLSPPVRPPGHRPKISHRFGAPLKKQADKVSECIFNIVSKLSSCCNTAVTNAPFAGEMFSNSHGKLTWNHKCAHKKTTFTERLLGCSTETAKSPCFHQNSQPSRTNHLKSVKTGIRPEQTSPLFHLYTFACSTVCYRLNAAKQPI